MMADLEVLVIEDCYAENETPKALLVRLPDDEEVWIPKGHIDDDSEVYERGHNGKLVITKWIAQQKGLIERGKLKYVGP